jgi:hypothetical protein
MKKLFSLVLSAMIALTPYYAASSQGMFAKKKPPINTRGKANAKELAKEIHTAMQTGNTDRLTIFMPTAAELKDLKKASTNEKAVECIETLDAKALENNLKQDLSTVQSQLSAQSISPAMTTITEVTTTRGSVKTPGVIPVTVTLTDAKQKPATVAFEAIKINKRIYLLRGLQVKNDMQAVNLEEKAKP